MMKNVIVLLAASGLNIQSGIPLNPAADIDPARSFRTLAKGLSYPLRVEDSFLKRVNFLYYPAAVWPWLRYLIFQIPGWIITAAVLWSLWHWQFIPKWLAVVGFFGWVLKDLLLYPFLRRAYETNVTTGSAALVGATGIAEEDLTPHGYIRVRGELWRAVASPPDQVVNAGAEVEIVSADGMRVFVRASAKN